MNNGETPLYKAAYRCNIDLIKMLIEDGANIETFTEFDKKEESGGYTPLYVTVSNACTEGAKLLLEAGAKSHSDNIEATAIKFARYLADKNPSTHTDVFDLIMKHHRKDLEVELPKLAATFDNSRSFEVVVVRYNEDLDWLNYEFKDEKIIIYNKGKDDLNLEDLPANSQIINIPNVGWFGGTILYHLANNYETLADRTFFAQGEPYEQPVPLPMLRVKGDFKSSCEWAGTECVPN